MTSGSDTTLPTTRRWVEPEQSKPLAVCFNCSEPVGAERYCPGCDDYICIGCDCGEVLGGKHAPDQHLEGTR